MEFAKKRLIVCKSCDKFNKLTKICKICSCFMPMKTKLKNSECPLYKWGKEDGPS